MIIGDDDESAAGKDLGEHVASFERAGTVNENGVEVTELADPGELGGIQLMDDLIAGVLHGTGEVVGVGLGVDVDHQGVAVCGNGVGGQRKRDHRLGHAALLIHYRDDVTVGLPGVARQCAARSGGIGIHADRVTYVRASEHQPGRQVARQRPDFLGVARCVFLPQRRGSSRPAGLSPMGDIVGPGLISENSDSRSRLAGMTPENVPERPQLVCPHGDKLALSPMETSGSPAGPPRALAAEPGDNPLYHPVLPVAAANPGMAADQETVTAAVAVTAGELVPRAGARPPGPAAVAAELLARTRAELPVLAGLGEREELLAAAWLASLRAPRTRRAYAGDVRGWLGWLADRSVDVLGASRVHVDLWVAGQQDQGRSLDRAAPAVRAVELLPLLRRS